MRSRVATFRGPWWKILLLSLLAHILAVAVFWPQLRSLFQDAPAPPGMRVALSQQQAPAAQPEQKPVPEKEKEPEPEKPEPEREQPEKKDRPEPEPEPKPKPEEQLHLPRDTHDEVDLDGTDLAAPEEEKPLKADKPSPDKGQGGQQSSRELDPGSTDGQLDRQKQKQQKPSGETAQEGGGDSGGNTDADRGEKSGKDSEQADPGGPEVASEASDEPGQPDSDKASMTLGGRQSPSEPGPTLPEGAEKGNDGFQALGEEEMDAVRGGSPVSEIEERRMRMANKFLARMKRQILARWEQPDDARARHKGEIRFSVDSRGYLRASHVHLSSGHKRLDESALRAVRSVKRYRVPDSPAIVRQYYQDLRFTFSGAPIKAE